MSTLNERVTKLEQRQERVERYVNETIVQIGDPEDALQFCIDAGIAVTFDYIKPTGETKLFGLVGQGYVHETRTVSPYAVTESQKGDLLVVGFDHDRDDIRQFRIDRILGGKVDPDLTLDYVDPVSD